MSLYIPKEIQEFPQDVINEKHPTCEEIKLLVQYVSERFHEEHLQFYSDRFQKYMSLQKFFPFGLFPWEKFVFGLHCCTYTEDGQFPRWSDLMLNVARGTGKNGYAAFENFGLLTPINPSKLYHIDCFAVAEEQAQKTFDEMYRVLESNPKYFSKFYYWTKEKIQNKKTGSVYAFKTSAAKSKDSGQQGKVDYDEVHQWENYDLIDVTNSGLGKKDDPRRLITSSNGYLLEGPLEDFKRDGRAILHGEYIDNSFLPFIANIESEDEIHKPEAWVKANPSLPYLPKRFMATMQKQYNDYIKDPNTHLDFPTKRLNWVVRPTEKTVASNEDILATNAPIEIQEGAPAVIGIDYGSRRDFGAVGYFVRTENKKLGWKVMTFVTKNNPDLARIRAPLRQWEAKGLLQFVDEPEITPEHLTGWLSKEASAYGLNYLAAALDDFRFPYVRKSLLAMGFSDDTKPKTIKKVRPSDLMKAAPLIMSEFVNRNIVAGDNNVFRWAVRNVKLEYDKYENIIFGKIEKKSRKTDPFMAMCAAYTLLEEFLPERSAEVLDIDFY